MDIALIHWKNTAKARQAKSQKTQISLQHIYDEWKILNNAAASVLILEDFKYLSLEKEPAIGDEKFEKFFNIILKNSPPCPDNANAKVLKIYLQKEVDLTKGNRVLNDSLHAQYLRFNRHMNF